MQDDTHESAALLQRIRSALIATRHRGSSAQVASHTSRTVAFLLAIAVYTTIALIWTWPLVQMMHTHAGVPPYRGNLFDLFARNDQLLSVWGATANARALLSLDFVRLIDNGSCYPMPDAVVLGEHMIELGILALPGYALTGDPLVAYNSACLLLIVIAGVAMFSLIRSWTGSIVGALFAGLIYAFHPSRVNNLVHPAVVGTHWIPFVLLFFDRVIVDGKLRHAIFLWLITTLACLTGSYPMLVLVAFGAAYGLIRFVQLRTRLNGRRVALLAAPVAAVASIVLPLMARYAEAEQIWYPIRPKYAFYANFEHLLPGHEMAAGVIVLVLAGLALLYARRSRGEPVFAVLAATTVCLLLSCQGTLWPGGPPLTPPFEWLRNRLPLISAVRVPAEIRAGVYLGLAALAGIGLARGLQFLRFRLRLVAGGLIVGALLLEVFFDPVAVSVYDRSQDFVLRRVRPDEQMIATYAAFDEQGLDGAVLDLPYNTKYGGLAQMPKYVLHAAYHGRPMAACFNSFLPPTYDNVGRLSDRTITTGQADELIAAGFHNIVWHRADGGPIPKRLLAAPGVHAVRQTEVASALRLTGDPLTHSILTEITPIDFKGEDSLRVGPYDDAARLYLNVQNASPLMWASLRPLETFDATLSWYPIRSDAEAVVISRTRIRLLLPLALAPGTVDRIPIPALPLPPPGLYRVRLEVPFLKWDVTSSGPIQVG